MTPHAGGVETIGVGEFIAGILAGALITMAGNAVGAGLRWRREDKLRFHEQRLQAYTRYLAVTNLEKWTRASRGLEEHKEQERDWARAFSELQILATPRVRKAAQELRRQSLEDLADVSDVFNAQMQDFVAAVQEEIGVKLSARIGADQRK